MINSLTIKFLVTTMIFVNFNPILRGCRQIPPIDPHPPIPPIHSHPVIPGNTIKKEQQKIEAIKKFARGASKRQADNSKINSRQEFKEFLLEEVDKEVGKAIKRQVKKKIVEEVINEYCNNENDETKKNRRC